MQRVAVTTAALLLAMSRVAPADAPAKRHLVYAFTVGVASDQHDQDSSVRYNGMNGAGGQAVYGTGDTSYKGNASDSGQITVDYQGIEADGGLVVSVAEAARDRTSAASTCVVYASTNVRCLGNLVNPEEFSVLRTLAPKFFDPSALDANRHWKVVAEAAGVEINFTATPQGGTVMTIDSQRNEKRGNGESTAATAKYTYDYSRDLPTQLKEYTTLREQSGVGKYTNITVDVTANLVSDSLAPKS